MKLDCKTGYRPSPSIQNSECLDKKCMETGKQGFDTQVGGREKDGPMAVSKSKVLDIIANQVTSEEYIGDNEPGFGITHGDPNKRGTVIESQEGNESFPSCKKFMDSELYSEKTLTEVSSKLITCYKAGSYFVIKDICVDDGRQSEEKCFVENDDSNEKLSTDLSQLDLDAEDGLSKKLVGKMTPLLKCGIYSNSMLEKDNVLKCADSGKEIPKDGDLEELVFDAAGHSNDSTIPSNQVEAQVGTTLVDFANEKDSESKKEHSQNKISAKEEQFLQFSSKIGNKSITFTFDPSMPPPSLNSSGDVEEEKAAAVATGRQAEHHHVHSLAELCLEERSSSGEPTSSMVSSCHVPEELNGTQGRNSSSDPAVDVSEKLQPGVRSMSASITFSGPVQYSGSISLRSDSSTTSARSFAFPVLQSEWSGSPVRMAKADARQFRKHRGWRMSLLCCRF